jgi:catechol 2,3-dioxygenase-like lactoylglutathione lyase family enzyme
MVDDQDKAERFYTEILGFEKKTDIPMGEFRWLTVISPEGSPEIELVLEPNAHPAAATFQAALKADNIPATAFESVDIQGEYDRLTSMGVEFTTEPTPMGDVTLAVFDDTCGNLVQLYQV